MPRDLTHLINNQRGQGVVEYTLILILVVAMISGLATQLHKPLKKWTEFYLGDYTYCLLDSGELPPFAGGQPIECEKMAEQNGYQKGGQGKLTQAKDEKDKDLSSDANGGNSGNSSQAGRASSRRGYGGNNYRHVNDKSNPNNGGADAASTDKKKIELSSKDTLGRNTNYGSFYSNRTGPRTSSLPRSRLRQYEEDEAERDENRAPKVVEGGSGDQKLKPKRLAVKPPERKTAAIEDKDMNFDFGQMLRMAVIIMIIVATLYILGTQINSITKSSEK